MAIWSEPADGEKTPVASAAYPCSLHSRPQRASSCSRHLLFPLGHLFSYFYTSLLCILYTDVTCSVRSPPRPASCACYVCIVCLLPERHRRDLSFFHYRIPMPRAQHSAWQLAAVNICSSNTSKCKMAGGLDSPALQWAAKRNPTARVLPSCGNHRLCPIHWGSDPAQAPPGWLAGSRQVTFLVKWGPSHALGTLTGGASFPTHKTCQELVATPGKQCSRFLGQDGLPWLLS